MKETNTMTSDQIETLARCNAALIERVEELASIVANQAVEVAKLRTELARLPALTPERLACLERTVERLDRMQRAHLKSTPARHSLEIKVARDVDLVQRVERLEHELGVRFRTVSADLTSVERRTDNLERAKSDAVPASYSAMVERVAELEARLNGLANNTPSVAQHDGLAVELGAAVANLRTKVESLDNVGVRLANRTDDLETRLRELEVESMPPRLSTLESAVRRIDVTVDDLERRS